MKCLKATLAYFFDKGAQMVLLAVVPSLLTALLFSPSAGLYMLLEFETVNTEGFAALYEQMHFLPYDFFWVGIIGLVLCFFVLALLFGIVDRHMRIGEFTISFRRAKTRINYNILTAAKFGLTAGVIFELCDLLLTLLYYVWAQVFGAGAAWLVFALISLLAVGALLLFIACAILLWPPFMLHTGLRTRDAFRMGWRQMSGRVLLRAHPACRGAAVCRGDAHRGRYYGQHGRARHSRRTQPCRRHTVLRHADVCSVLRRDGHGKDGPAKDGHMVQKDIAQGFQKTARRQKRGLMRAFCAY